jgi:hypothetical protein
MEILLFINDKVYLAFMNDSKKTKKIIPRAVLKQPEDYLEYNPYKSIIKALELAPKHNKKFMKGIQFFINQKVHPH